MGDSNKPYSDMSKEDLEKLLGQHTQTAPQAQIKLTPAVVLLGRLTQEVKTAVLDLTDSSNRLEGLTCKLIWLTVVLAFLTVILAVPEIRNAVVWLRAR